MSRGGPGRVMILDGSHGGRIVHRPVVVVVVTGSVLEEILYESHQSFDDGRGRSVMGR